jgi:Outer membrane protein beta-barrel domain
MKRLLLIVLVGSLMVLNPVQAQLEKGTFMAGIASSVHLAGSATGSELMSLGYASTKYGSSDAYKTTTFNLMPRGGYFVIDKLAVGLDVILSTYTQKSSDDGSRQTSTMIEAAPFVRYYYPLSKVNLFGEATVGFGTENSKYKYGTSESNYKYGIFMFGVGAGAAVPIGEKVSFDTMVGYINSTWKDKDDESSGKEKTSGVLLRMGFIVYLLK